MLNVKRVQFRLSEVEKRLSDLQANEGALRNRVEELEEVEDNLQQNINLKAKEVLEKERHWRQKMTQLEEEVEVQRQALNRYTTWAEWNLWVRYQHSMLSWQSSKRVERETYAQNWSGWLGQQSGWNEESSRDQSHWGWRDGNVLKVGGEHSGQQPTTSEWYRLWHSESPTSAIQRKQLLPNQIPEHSWPYRKILSGGQSALIALQLLLSIHPYINHRQFLLNLKRSLSGTLHFTTVLLLQQQKPIVALSSFLSPSFLHDLCTWPDHCSIHTSFVMMILLSSCSVHFRLQEEPGKWQPWAMGVRLITLQYLLAWMIFNICTNTRMIKLFHLYIRLNCSTAPIQTSFLFSLLKRERPLLRLWIGWANWMRWTMILSDRCQC